MQKNDFLTNFVHIMKFMLSQSSDIIATFVGEFEF